MNSTNTTSIQSQSHIQAWTRPIYSRLAFQAKPRGKQDAELPGMQININAIQTTTNIPECMTMYKLQQAMS